MIWPIYHKTALLSLHKPSQEVVFVSTAEGIGGHEKAVV